MIVQLLAMVRVLVARMLTHQPPAVVWLAFGPVVPARSRSGAYSLQKSA